MTVKYVTVSSEYSGQRLDNYLFRECKGVPKSRIYRAIRGGEVRINKKRCKADARLKVDDVLRIPPLRQSESNTDAQVSERLSTLIESRILIENKDYIMINKPSGIPVHGGSNVSIGLIEALRQLRPRLKFLELVHRLDRETSGCLLIAKKRSILVMLQDWFRARTIKKRYWVLVKGQWGEGEKRCDFPLIKNQLENGERIVKVHRDGKPSVTVFRLLQQFEGCALLQATLKTGRTHQIRVHLQALGYPIAGDTKYGDRDFNKMMRNKGLTRLFLQCMELSYRDHERLFGACTFLDDDLKSALQKI